MTALERFLRYLQYDTQSEEEVSRTPSTDRQRLLGAALAQEMQEMDWKTPICRPTARSMAGCPPRRERRVCRWWP